MKPKNYFISVYIGLLTEEHFLKIGPAVWVYLWFLNKVTKIDKDGMGWVLGGKPINLKDVEFIPRRSVQRYISMLREGGYIVEKRTPYGFIVGVTKAKKVFGGAPNTAHPDIPKVAHHPTKFGASLTKFGASNKTRQLDKTVDIYTRYSEKINKSSKLLDKAKVKIRERMKTYSEEDLFKAIDNFAADSWWMEHNAHRGVAWFFHSDERIEQFMNMKPRAKVSSTNQPLPTANKYTGL